MTSLFFKADGVEDTGRPDIPAGGDVVDGGAAHLHPLVVELAAPVHASGIGVSGLEVLGLVGLVVHGSMGLLGSELGAGAADAHDVGWEVCDIHHASADLLEAAGLAGILKPALGCAWRLHELARLTREELAWVAHDMSRRARLNWDLTSLDAGMHGEMLLRLTWDNHGVHGHGLADESGLHLFDKRS